MRTILLVSALLLFPVLGRAQSASPSAHRSVVLRLDVPLKDRAASFETPERRPYSMGLQVGGGVVGGIVVGAPLALMMVQADVNSIGTVAAVAGAGYLVGSGFGSNLVARRQGFESSLVWALAGAAGGAVAGVLLGEPTAGWSYIVLVPAGATIALNLALP
jgi:hypothetical protein